jgi:ribonuclease/clavin/mitogillin
VTVLAPNPSVFTGAGTQTYVLGGREVVVIDPGSDDAGHLDRVTAAAEGMGTTVAVVLTHHHTDHTDGAVELARRLHAPLMAHPHALAPPLDRELTAGDVVGTGGAALTVVATPGHCRDHVCLDWRAHGIVFAGDLVAGRGYIVIDPPEGNMRDYLASLGRVRDLDPELLLPAHGPAIGEPRAYLDGYIAHRLEREARVLAAVPEGGGTAAEILPLAYDDTPEAMHPVAARSLAAHLEKLVEDGRLAVGDEAGATRYRRV